jgi:dCMP deaminase
MTYLQRPNPDTYFLDMLKLVASRSTCARRQVGAIIVSVDNYVLATGYNGVPRGFVHCIDQPCLGANDKAGNSERCLAVHAEINALLQCQDITKAHKMYTSVMPCFACAKVIANTPIKKLICVEPYADTRGQEILNYSGIHVNTYFNELKTLVE